MTQYSILLNITFVHSECTMIQFLMDIKEIALYVSSEASYVIGIVIISKSTINDTVSYYEKPYRIMIVNHVYNQIYHNKNTNKAKSRLFSHTQDYLIQ